MLPFSKSAYILSSLFLIAVEQSVIEIIGRYHVIPNTRQTVATLQSWTYYPVMLRFDLLMQSSFPFLWKLCLKILVNIRTTRYT